MTLDDIATCALVTIAAGSLLVAAHAIETNQRLKVENHRLRSRLQAAWAHTTEVTERLLAAAVKGRPARASTGRFTRRPDAA